MLNERVEPASLAALLASALREFPEYETEIRHHVLELSHVLVSDETDADQQANSARAANATSKLTGDDPVSLLFKFEGFLESLLVSGQRRGAARGR